jgi:trk system potassium uptake protein
MASIIVGGGKIGFYLLKTLLERRVDTILIERNPVLCKKIANELDVTVIEGDGTDIGVLRDAGIESAGIVAAVTGTDEENLVVCKIAKVNFAVPITFARVNNPKNTAMFKALGIDNTVCSTEVIANMIERELDRDEYHVVQTFENGELLLAEVMITAGNSWNRHKIKELRLPDECVITSIFRSGKILFPKGESEILEFDKVVLITNKAGLLKLRRQTAIRVPGYENTAR